MGELAVLASPARLFHRPPHDAVTATPTTTKAPLGFALDGRLRHHELSLGGGAIRGFRSDVDCPSAGANPGQVVRFWTARRGSHVLYHEAPYRRPARRRYGKRAAK